MVEGAGNSTNTWMAETLNSAGRIWLENQHLGNFVDKLRTGQLCDIRTLMSLRELLQTSDKLREHIIRVLLYQKITAIKETLLEEALSKTDNRSLQRTFREVLKETNTEERAILFEILGQHEEKDKNWVKVCTTVLALLKAAKQHPSTADQYRLLRSKTFAIGRELGLTSSSERMPRATDSPSPKPKMAPLPPSFASPPPTPEFVPLYPIETTLDLGDSREAEHAFFDADRNGFEDKYGEDLLTPEERHALTTRRTPVITGSEAESIESIEIEDDTDEK